MIVRCTRFILYSYSSQNTGETTDGNDMKFSFVITVRSIKLIRPVLLNMSIVNMVRYQLARNVLLVQFLF